MWCAGAQSPQKGGETGLMMTWRSTAMWPRTKPAGVRPTSRFSCLPCSWHMVRTLAAPLKKKASPRCTYHGSYRLIHHLSHPAGLSINDNIPQDLCTVQYQTIENAKAHIRALGQGCFMAKTDIAEAFRIIPIQPAQYQMFGLCWRGQYYYDKCLAMGCSSNCQNFEHLSSALQWIATHQLDIQYISHILDDFIISNNAYSKTQLQQFLHMCTDIAEDFFFFYPHRYSHCWVMS